MLARHGIQSPGKRSLPDRSWKMFHCNYLSPPSLGELLTILHQYGAEARVIAGGTDLIPQLRLGTCSPDLLVDPVCLRLFEAIETEHDIRLGASFTHSQVLSSPLLQRECPALVAACQQVGGPPVRNRGTLVGNLANASPAADSALPLLVYDAELVVNCLTVERLIPLKEFFLGPGLTCLADDEFIRQISIPRMPPRTKAIFLKLGNRQAMAIAVTSVAVRVTFDDDGRIAQMRIALGSVAPTPLRAYAAEAMLQSHTLDAELIQLAAQAVQQAASPITDLRASAEYRSKMVSVLTRRALEMLAKDSSLPHAYA
jgi:xanthine dehydrogenase FAD-binding subunit